jgi:diguanylate cyclase (GGDEF)-like protein
MTPPTSPRPAHPVADPRTSLRGGDPVRVIAAVVGPPLLAEAVVAAADLAGGVALLVRLAGLTFAAAAVMAVVVRPLLAAVAQARITATDLESQLLAERATRDFRERFDRAIASSEAEPAALRTGLRAVMELLPEYDVTLLLSAPDEPRIGWSVRMVDGALEPAVPTPGLPGCVALSSGTTAVTATSHALDACPHLVDPAVEVCAVCLPFRLADRPLGVVCITGAPGEVPDADTIAVAEWVVDRTGARVAEQRRRKGPSTPGPEDPVTALPTEVALRSHLRDMVRSLTPFCVSVVSIDGADVYRAEYGDEEYDDALRLVADTLVTTLRPDDVVCRLDGPRFAAVLSQCNADQAAAALERARESLVLALAMEGAPHFTCSAGIVESHRAGSLDETVSLADAAREAAHLQGGNRVAVADAEPA